MLQILILPEDTPERSLNGVWGHMQFPECRDKAFELYVRLELQQAGVRSTKNTDPVSLPASFIKALLNGHSAEELEKDDERRGRSGVTAGLLLINLRLASTAKRRASMNMAVEILTHGIEKRQLPPMPYKPYPNKPEMSVAWQHMAPVAHLWATLCMAHIAPSDWAGVKPIERATAFLAKALAFQQWATAPGPKRQAILDPEATWLLPFPPGTHPNLLGDLSEHMNPAIRALLSPTRKR